MALKKKKKLIPKYIKNSYKSIANPQTVRLKWADDLIRHFFKDMQMASRYMKGSSTSPVIREKQIKTTVRYHLRPFRTAIFKMTRKNKVAVMWREVNPCTLLVLM